jgi:hypothetical protein
MKSLAKIPKFKLPMINPSTLRRNPSGGKVIAHYGVPAVLIAGLGAAAAYAITKNRDTASTTAAIGAVIGLGLAHHAR